VLHDLSKGCDDYYYPGSEPHKLTYEPLLRRLTRLEVNYSLLRINNTTDRMALEFSRVYGRGNANLHKSNMYHGKMTSPKARGARSKHRMTDVVEPQFEELQLGTSYKLIWQLVVSTVTSSVSRTTGRLSLAWNIGRRPTRMRHANHLPAIQEYEKDTVNNKPETIPLDTGRPKWKSSTWFDETLHMEGLCPDVSLHNASTLNEMMDSDAAAGACPYISHTFRQSVVMELSASVDNHAATTKNAH
jgi:hypothetical protein